MNANKRYASMDEIKGEISPTSNERENIELPKIVQETYWKQFDKLESFRMSSNQTVRMRTVS